MPLQDMTNKYAYSKYVVDPNDSTAYYSIQDAINDANATGNGGTILIQDVAITESIVVYDKIAIMGTGNAAKIIGQILLPNSGNVYFENITLENAGDIVFSNVNGTTNVTFTDVEFIQTTNGYDINIPNFTGGTVKFIDCFSSSTGDESIFNLKSSTLIVMGSRIGTATGTSATNQTSSFYNSSLVGDIVTNHSMSMFNCSQTGDFMITGGTYTGENLSVTGKFSISGTSVLNLTNFSITSGASAAVTSSSSGSASLYDGKVDSTNINVFAGSGQYYFGNIDFVNNSTNQTASKAGFVKSTAIDTPFVVGGYGKFSTVQSAIDSASAAGGGIVKISSGTYAENITLYTGIILQGSGHNTILRGFITPPTSGQIEIRNMKLSNDSHLIYSNTSGSTTINIYDCEFSIDAGITNAIFSLSDFTGTMNVFNCIDTSSGNSFVYVYSGTLSIYNSKLGNSTQPCLGYGTVNINNSQITSNIAHNGSGMNILNSNITGTVQSTNTPCTFTGSSISGNVSMISSSWTISRCTLAGQFATSITGSGLITNSRIGAGTATAAVAHNAVGTLTLYDNFIYSTNATPIGGSGTITLGPNMLPGYVYPLLTPPNAQTDNYTLTSTDCGKTITITNAVTKTLTLPQNSTENLPIGFQCILIQGGAAQITVAKQGSDTISSADSLVKTRTTSSAVTIIKRGSGDWFISGDLTA